MQNLSLHVAEESGRAGLSGVARLSYGSFNVYRGRYDNGVNVCAFWH